MKLMKRFFVISLISAFALMLPISARADDINAAANTGDQGIIGIGVALVAFIATAFITMRLTKHKNRKNKL